MINNLPASYQLSDNKNKYNEILKLIAIIAMFIDHIGSNFFPNYPILRIIGRIAYPLFAYQLAQGYVNTSSYPKYMVRLWIFALVSQMPYTLLFQTTNLNIIFTLMLSMFLIRKVDKKEYSWIPLIIVISILAPIDYGLYGVLMPFVFYLFRKSKSSQLLVQLLLTFAYVIASNNMIQMFAVIGVIIALFLTTDKFKININRYVFYWFYPAHLTILAILKFTLILIYFN